MSTAKINVKKRNGRLEKLNINKINLCAERACLNLEGVSASEVVLDAHVQLYDKISTKEIKRDLLVYARRDPQGFLNLVDDPMVKLQSKIQTFFDNKLLVLRNKDVYYNTKSNKKRMLVVPQGEKPLEMVALYLQSDE